MADLEKVFGAHAVRAMLEKHPERVLTVWLAQGARPDRLEQIEALAAQMGVAIQSCQRKQLDDWVSGNHQGIVADCRPARAMGERELSDALPGLSSPLILILDGVTDPHNLGACLRSADAAGVSAVIAPRDKAAGLTPVVRKVACGAAETVPFYTVTNLARTMGELKEQGIWLAGAAGEADKTIYEVDLKGALGLVMGAEGHGLRRLTRERCDFLVNIPMAGAVSSLNVSVATGICLFEAVRQRR